MFLAGKKKKIKIHIQVCSFPKDMLSSVACNASQLLGLWNKIIMGTIWVSLTHHECLTNAKCYMLLFLYCVIIQLGFSSGREGTAKSRQDHLH